MKRLFRRLLTAFAFGFVAMTALYGAAQAESGREYRVLGCDQPFDPPPQPGMPPIFVVVVSLLPDEIGQPCETVLNSLADQGFRLIDAFPRTDSFGPGPGVGVLHYLQRDDDDG